MTHMYQRIASDLRDGIRDGRYRPGTPLPSIHALATRYESSTMPVRDAIDILLHEGLVIVRPRSGTYVALPEDVSAE
jgi:GntR family transcriptional regulator